MASGGRPADPLLAEGRCRSRLQRMGQRIGSKSKARLLWLSFAGGALAEDMQPRMGYSIMGTFTRPIGDGVFQHLVLRYSEFLRKVWSCAIAPEVARRC